MCAERLREYFYRPDETIPLLNLANGSPRQQRSERREASVLVGRCCLKYTDLVSMQVGIPTQDGFLSLSADYIAKQTNLSIRRVQRTLSDWKKSGLIDISQTRKRLPNGSWKGLTSIKTVSHRLFTIFGLDRILKRERDKAKKRRQKREKQERNRDQTKLNGASRARVALTMNRLNKRSSPPENNAKYLRYIEYKRHLSIKMLELKQAHPGWSHAELEKGARRLIAELFPDYVDEI